MQQKYKQIKFSSTTPSRIVTKAYLKGLETEVQASKVAVVTDSQLQENITRLGTNEQKFQTKIDTIQAELQQCVCSISNESKKQVHKKNKQKVLMELISLLKGEMFKYQTTKKKQEEAERLKIDKTICKMQYEIDQLLQKHNQEIAKIHQLKDIANSRRSERVVYSNLFKKLQKQIKHYEELYQQAIIKTESTKNKEVAKENSPEFKQILINVSKEDIVLDKTICKKTENFSSPKKLQGEREKREFNLFVTEQPESKKKFIELGEASCRQESRNTVHREQRIANTRETLQQINKLTNIIEKFKIHAQCGSAEEVLEVYQNIEKQNEEIVGTIKQIDQEIEYFQSKMQQFGKKIREDEFSRRYTIQTPDSSHEQEILDAKMAHHQTIQLMLQQICEIGALLGVDLQNWKQQASKSILQQEEIQVIDNRIDQLKAINEDPIRKGLRDDTNSSESAVEVLLDRMQKFSNSERILDRNLFQQEYYKELSKRKMKHSKK